MILLKTSFGLLLFAIACNAQVPGGRQRVNLEKAEEFEKIKEFSNFAVSSITSKRQQERENSKLNFKLIRIIEATQQVVAGMNYFIKLRMKDAYCRMGCSVEVCDVKIFDQPWTNKRELGEFKCTTQRGRDANPLGARKDEPIDKEDVIKAVHYAVSDANKNSNKENFFKLSKVIKAQSQVVSGFNYHVTFAVGETNCKRKETLVDGNNGENCQNLENTQQVTCTATVWDQPWLPRRHKITRTDCEL